jgi:hypothetical protein
VRLTVLPATEPIEVNAGQVALQGMSGRFEVAGDDVYFAPRFPFVEGTRYSVLVESPVRGEQVSIDRQQVARSPRTDVLSISPTAADLPLNQLRFYVQFSNPMSEGYARDAVRVRRADSGEVLDGVFLDMDPELWDPERRRLTLLLDPARIKRGLVPNREAGYPLRDGVAVIVEVDPSFCDAEARQLRAGAERLYRIGPAVRRRVEPTAWRIRCPSPGTKDPLTVEFDRPLDRALVDRCIHLAASSGRRVDGSSAVVEGERSWEFAPELPWSAGRVRIVIDAHLEDLAGNSVARVFDRDLTRAGDVPRNVRRVEVELCIGSA